MNLYVMSHHKRNAVIALALTAFSAGALADGQTGKPPKSDWRIIAGFGVYAFPEFDGAKDHKVLPLPMIDVTYKNRVFFNFFEGLGIKVIDTDAFTLKAAIGFASGRDEDDDEIFSGTGDIDDTAKFSLGAEYKVGRFEPFVKVSKYLGATDGMQAEFGVGTTLKFGDSYASPMLKLKVAAEYSDEDHTQGYFGINTKQSFDSGLTVYTPSAGVSSMSAGATYIHPFSGRWATTVNLKLSQMLGDAADSPLVLEENQVSGGVFVTYTF
jgi:outer membrane protein